MLRGLLPDGSAVAAPLDLLVELAQALAARCECRQEAGDPNGALADLDEAIAALQVVWDADLVDPQDAAFVADMLGQLRYARYQDSDPGDPGDLDAAIRLLAVAAADGEPDWATLGQLVLALSDRFAEGDDLADLRALTHWGELLLDMPGEEAERGFVHQLVGLAQLDLGRAADPPERGRFWPGAIRHLQSALAAMPSDDDDRPGLLADLAGACWEELSGGASDPAAVDQMTGYAVAAWQSLPTDEESRPLVAIYLAVGIHERLLRPGEPFDLDAAGLAIGALGWAEPRMTDPDLHTLIVVLLGHFLVARGQYTRSADDLAAAQPWVAQAARQIRPGDPRTDLATTLASTMSVLVGTGLSADLLDEAIELLATVVGPPGADPERAALRREMLGGMLVQRGAHTSSERDVDDGIEHLRAAWEMTPPSHAGRIVLAVNLASALLTRHIQRGDRQDLDAAQFYLSAGRALAAGHSAEVRSLVSDADTTLVGVGGVLALVRGLAGEEGALDEAVAALRAAVGSLPPGHPSRQRLRSDLAYALMARAGRGGRSPGDLREAVTVAQDSQAAEGTLMHPIAVMRAGGMLAAAGLAERDPAAVREAVQSLTAAIGAIDRRFGERLRFAAVLGAAHEALHQLTGEPGALDAAIGWLEEARRELAGRPGHPQRVGVLTLLGRCHRGRGSAALARETCLQALRERARDVLLQSGTSRALGAARQAAAQAAEVAGWCLADGEPALAVSALELGRGLALHAATAFADVVTMLQEAGRADLAAQWQQAADPDGPWDRGAGVADYGDSLLAGAAPLLIPSDLRGRVLAALAERDAGERLLAPPAPAAIANALAMVDADALVYLIEPRGADPGRALLVRGSAGSGAILETFSLPRLTDDAGGPLAAYTAAAEALAGEGDQPAPATQARWRRALEELCGWAYPAVMGPLLAHVRQWRLGRPPRLVLVPAGPLGLVPWHAACRQDGGPRPVYALEEAVISYAASGRQLVEASARHPLPPAAGQVIVGNPDFSLPYAGLEALAIRDVCYPEARYLGAVVAAWGQRADGPGRADEVLAGLPAGTRDGAAVLHLGCHAAVLPDDPGRSCLALASGESLTVETILRQVGSRSPGAPGGLVSLAACMSDLGGPEHDEALTLATAFLAAGAVSVVGARWSVPDGATSLLMFMFHRFVAVEGKGAAEALRLAQLWMIDPDRTAPADLPGTLAGQVGTPPDLAGWAAFTHQGR